MAAVEIRDLVVRYGETTALDGVTLSVEPGTALGVVGPNGSGKSTLLKAIAGIVRAAAGTIRVLDQPPGAAPAGSIGYVPQIEDVDLAFPVSVRDVVTMGRYPRLAPFRAPGAADRAAIERALALVDLEDLAGRHIGGLSGGQQQRAFVARALAQEPRLLLLDEPTTGVDAATEEALRVVVRRLVGEGLPVLMTTHDLDRAPDWFDRLVVIDRRVLADGAPEAVLESGAYSGIREHSHVHGHHRGDAGAD